MILNSLARFSNLSVALGTVFTSAGLRYGKDSFAFWGVSRKRANSWLSLLVSLRQAQTHGMSNHVEALSYRIRGLGADVPRLCFLQYHDSNMKPRAFDEREIILELFPGTSPELLPPGEVLYWQDREGCVHIAEAPHHLVLEPLDHRPSIAPVLCEACQRQLSRSAAAFFRFRVKEDERHFRYLSLCRDTDSCAGMAPPRRLREILFRGILP